MTFLEPIASAAAAANSPERGDFVMDGILHCGKCGTPKQCRINILGNERVVSCLCKCKKKNMEDAEEQMRKREYADRIMRLRSVGIVSQAFRNARFEADDGNNPSPMRTVKKYADKWEDFYAENIGLLLYGGVGTGKTFAAACIANSLIDRNIPVYMENFSGIFNTLNGLPREEKNNFIADLMRYPLMILDDFGMERQTEFAMEQVFNIVDSRYRSGKPLIVTTNLSVSEMANPKSRDHARIYDRVLEMCQPVNFGDSGRRAVIASEKMRKAKKMLM